MSRSTFPYHAVAFGRHWAGSFPFDLFEATATPSGSPDITVHLRSDPPPPVRTIPGSINRIQHDAEGIRYLAHGIATLDTYGVDRIDIRPGPAWTGHLPLAFYGSVTAAMMARRGNVPMHASAVSLDGEALMICGDAGAGKSTLTAALIAAGGALIADDLTVLESRGSEAPVIFAGRRTIRLFPDVADMLGDGVTLESTHGQSERKRIVVPPRVAPLTPTPLAGILVLGQTVPTMPQEVNALLVRQMYRPNGLRRVPGQPLRLLQLASVAARVPVMAMHAVETRSARDFRDVAQEAIKIFCSCRKPC